MSEHNETPFDTSTSSSSSSSSSSPDAFSTLPGGVETPLLTYLGVDLDTWEARFKNLSAQSRDILLVYLKVNFAKHVNYMAEIGSDQTKEEKIKRDADVKDVLHLYIQTFVCLSVVFPSVFANAEYAMAILDSLQEIDILIMRSMADGTSLSLDQIFPIALKPDKSGINLRAMSKEKNMPIRKNPLVMCFEGALVYLSISRGRYEHLLVPTLPPFLDKYPEFDYRKPYKERYDLTHVKSDEKEKFCKQLSPPEVNLLFRCYNMMVIVVEMTNDKAFKCCELSVRLIEGESGQGFKPGGDNGPRILHRMHLHAKLVKAKRRRPAPVPANSAKRDRPGVKYLDILTGVVSQDQIDEKNRPKKTGGKQSKSSKSSSDINDKVISPSSKQGSLKKKDHQDINNKSDSGSKRSSYSKKKDKQKHSLLNLASAISDKQPVGNLEFLNQLAEVAGALHSEESNNVNATKKTKTSHTTASSSSNLGGQMPPISIPNLPLPMHLAGPMAGMPMTMPMPGMTPMSAMQMHMQMQMQMQMPPIPLNIPTMPMHLSMPSMSPVPMPTSSEFVVPVQFAGALQGLGNHPEERNDLTEREDANGVEDSQELSQVSIESNISRYNF